MASAEGVPQNCSGTAISEGNRGETGKGKEAPKEE